MSDNNAPNSKNNATVSQPPKQIESIIPTRYLLIGIAVAVVALVILVLLVILAVRNPIHTETVRDIAIIALAAESGLIGLSLIVLIVQVARLINMLEFEIKPILIHTSDTVNTVRGTATFMSEHVVSPMIKASGYASGLARLFGSVGSLFTMTRRRAPERQGAADESRGTIGEEP